MPVSHTHPAPRCERGSTLVEFGFVLLPLLALLFLTMDFAWAFFASACLQEGAREGVRFAITGRLPSGYTHQDEAIRDIVCRYSFGFISSDQASSVVQIHYYDPATLTEVTGTGSNAGGNVVKVAVSGVAVKPLLALWHSSSPLPLSASASDIVEPIASTSIPTR